MLLKNKINFYKGLLVLKSSDKLALQNLKNEIICLLNDSSLVSSDSCKSIIEKKKNKYITIFKSSFVHKKSKETFLFSTSSISIQFNVQNETLLNILLNKLENYKKNVNSFVQLKTFKIDIIENKNFSQPKFDAKILST